jgi:uncharacterized protein YodC (DUF2158 family)
MEQDYQIGDVVELKSGGPDMTVTEVRGAFVSCKWFDYEQHLQSDYFKQTVLRRSPTSST